MKKLIKELAFDLKADEKKLIEALKKHKLQYIDSIPPYFRFKSKIKDIETGTVAFIQPENFRIIRGYPKIQRALYLKSAFKKNFKKAVVEEKMDGYNVRVVKLNTGLAAITRKGLVDSYTTGRIEKIFYGNKFFEENPELTLCGEVVGLQNPFQEKSYPEERDFGFFIFDVINEKGKIIHGKKKQQLIKKFKLRAVHNFGEFTDAEKILKLVRKLGKEGREGVVIKEKGKMMKYTANSSTNNDLKYAFTFYNDYGVPFMFTRLLREAFQTAELGLKGKELDEEACKLGKSILIPMISTINEIKKGKEVTEDFEIKVPSEEDAIDFIDNLAHLGVRVSIKSKKQTDSGIVYNMSRHYPSTNDSVKSILKGGRVSD